MDGTRARMMLKTLIYKKMITVAPGQSQDFSEGRVLGLVTNDAGVIKNLFDKICNLVWLAITLLGSLIFFVRFFGWTYLLVLALAQVVISLTTHFENRL